VTAATVLHHTRTRTPLRKWFAAAWLIGQDKRGVSALFLARALALRYDTAWLMAHKLRHGLSERPEYPFKPGSGISGLVRFSPDEATRWVVRCVPQTRAQALRGRADGSRRGQPRGRVCRRAAP
jgi:hypothetical protein